MTKSSLIRRSENVSQIESWGIDTYKHFRQKRCGKYTAYFFEHLRIKGMTLKLMLRKYGVRSLMDSAGSE